MPGYVPTTNPSLDDDTMIPAGPDALGIQLRRQMLRDRLAASRGDGGDQPTDDFSARHFDMGPQPRHAYAGTAAALAGTNAGDSDIGGVPSGGPSGGQPSVSPAHPAGGPPTQLEPLKGNDAYRGVRFSGIDPMTIPQGPMAGGKGGGSPLDELIQRALARQAGAQPMTGTNLSTGQSFTMQPSARINRPEAQDVTAQWIASQERQRGQDANEKALEAAKYGVDAPVRALEAQGKLTAAQTEREHAWATNPANPAFRTAQVHSRLEEAQAGTEEAKARQATADQAPDPTHPGMTVGQVREARQAAVKNLLPQLATRGPAGRKAAADLLGSQPGLGDADTIVKASDVLGKATIDDVMPKLQPDIDAMKAEVASHSWRYGPEQAARTNATMQDILARAKAEGLEGPELDELGNQLLAEVRKVTSKTNPYASAGSALLGTLTGGLAGERAAP